MNFLFWNIRGRSLTNEGSQVLSALSAIVQQEPIDVIALAEYKEYSQQLDDLLVTQNGYARVRKMSRKTEKVEIFCNPAKLDISIAYHGGSATALRLTSVEIGNTINGFFCHLKSKLHARSADQRDSAYSYMEDVIEYEKAVENDNTFICGDFNMSPYEEGMVERRAFHSIMDEKVVLKNPKRGTRTKKWATFYNPMWGFAGDLGRGEVSGTYYYDGSKAKEYFWYIFDQVIIRPSILQYFDKTQLRILTRIGEHNLLDEEGMINVDYSDHLPICFTLNF